jgi:hypothetical protein
MVSDDVEVQHPKSNSSVLHLREHVSLFGGRQYFLEIVGNFLAIQSGCIRRCSSGLQLRGVQHVDAALHSGEGVAQSTVLASLAGAVAAVLNGKLIGSNLRQQELGRIP